MRVLGLESSCDETAASVVEDGTRILADVVASQNEVHEKYGGVVPELASRHHVVNVIPVLAEALARAGVGLDGIDGVAVTRGPGLVGACSWPSKSARPSRMHDGYPWSACII